MLLSVNSKDPIKFYPMPNGRYGAKFNGKGAIGHSTPRKAVDAVVSQLNEKEIAERLWKMYSIKTEEIKQ
jgi:hypothetical protein